MADVPLMAARTQVRAVFFAHAAAVTSDAIQRGESRRTALEWNLGAKHADIIKLAFDVFQLNRARGFLDSVQSFHVFDYPLSIGLG